MQKCPIYLYPNSLTLLLDLDQNTRIHNVMYQHELKIQKGLMNKIQFQVKNSDQKLLNISTATFVFRMFNDLDQRELVSKNLDILDLGTTSTRGLALLTLNETDTLDLDIGHYKFSVEKFTDGSFEPVYANTYYGSAGSLELRQDSFPVLQPSQLVTTETFEAGLSYNFDSDAQRFEFYSGRLPAHPEFNGADALHTVAFYLNNFKGVIKITGTMENSPGQFGNYATLSTLYFSSNTTKLVYTNVYGIWSYLQIIYYPDNSAVYDNRNYISPGGIGNPTPGTSFYPNGKIDKILYRH